MTTPRLLIPNHDVKAGIYYEITPRRRLYLDFIAACEGTDKTLDKTPRGYDIHFGGSRFSDFSRHPRKRIKAGGYTSSAAGRYQIMDFTEDWLLKNLHFPPNRVNFAPEFQDQRALYLIQAKRRALDEVDRDDFKGFCNLCSWEWASILPSRYGQGYMNLNQMTKIYETLKGIYGV
jgi:muramidase (phage lysozyme)